MFILLVLVFTIQTVPPQRVALAFDQPTPTACGDSSMLNGWNFIHGSCYRPAGVNLGDPWNRAVRVTFTGATTMVVTAPLEQITLETEVARCAGIAPCLRISNLQPPAGSTHVAIQMVDWDDRVSEPSASMDVTGRAVPGGAGLRVIPEP